MYVARPLLALLALACMLCTALASAVSDPLNLEDRSSKIRFTVTNKCKHAFAPVFLPPLPGRSTWPKLKHGESSSYYFKSDTYRGVVFSPLKKASTATGDGATWGEFDLASGDYDLSLAHGYNVPLLIWNQGRQAYGYCTPARCDGPNCRDAYRIDSGLVKGKRKGISTSSPNHSCPPTFGDWMVQFC
ncbi:hypothetical protein ACQY0O_006901 [Thecaphora frezii]